MSGANSGTSFTSMAKHSCPSSDNRESNRPPPDPTSSTLFEPLRWYAISQKRSTLPRNASTKYEFSRSNSRPCSLRERAFRNSSLFDNPWMRIPVIGSFLFPGNLDGFQDIHNSPGRPAVAVRVVCEGHRPVGVGTPPQVYSPGEDFFPVRAHEPG